jgi:two-component system, NarL family, response regulator NreC
LSKFAALAARWRRPRPRYTYAAPGWTPTGLARLSRCARARRRRRTHAHEPPCMATFAGLGVSIVRRRMRRVPEPEGVPRPPDRVGTTFPVRTVIADDHAVVRRGVRQVLDAEGDFDRGCRGTGSRERPPLGSQLSPRRARARPEHARGIVTRRDQRDARRVSRNPDRRAHHAGRSGAGSAGSRRRSSRIRSQGGRRGRAGRGDPPSRRGRYVPEPKARGAWPQRLWARRTACPNARSRSCRLLALGHTNAHIARELCLAARTIENHRARIQRKLRRTSRAELVRYALDHHLLQ